jgi:hypothetical protein
MLEMLAAVDWDKLIARGTPVGALLVFFYGVWKYNRAQQWKRAEYVAQEMKEFNRKESTQAIKVLLDWINPEISLPDETGAIKLTRVADAEVPVALRIPTDSSEHFNRKEFALRGMFDEFFDNLDQIGHYLQTKLVEPANVKPYLDYWLRIISGARKVGGGLDKPAAYLDALATYIKHYGWSGVTLLFERCGYQLRTRNTSD